MSKTKIELRHSQLLWLRLTIIKNAL